jgi:hypothetical protein
VTATNLFIEPLEYRRLLTITINGTSGVDTMIVERAGTVINVTINGTPSTRTIGAETAVQINAMGGSDTITVLDMPDLDLTVLCGTGNDALTIGESGPNGSSFNFDATVLAGEGGIDSVTFADNIIYGSTFEGQRYELAGGVFRTTHFGFAGNLGTASHDYDFETVTVTAGSDNSSFFVRSLGAETSVAINAGGGGDLLVLNPSLTSATISFDGQATGIGPPPVPNRVRIEDSLGSGSAGDVYTLDDNTFDRTGFGLLNFTNVADVSLTTHDLGAVVNLVGVINGSGNTDIRASVTGGAGDDVINVGNGDYDANIIGAVIIDGAGGSNSLAINDSTDVGTDGYDLSNNLFIKTNMNRGLNFFGIEELSITGNGAANVFDVSTENAQTVNLFGAGGNDSFLVTPRPATQLNIDGGAFTTIPGDSLTFESAEAAGSATFAASTYHFESAGDVVMTSVESFVLPPAAPSVPDLRAEHDSGISFSDNITNQPQPTFDGSAAANVAVVLSAGATSLGTTTASGTGAWSIASNALPDGTHAITAAARIPSSGLTGPRSTPLNVTIDTSAPATPTVAPDLSTGSDTGLNFTDNITRDNTPQFDGTLPANHIARLFVDGSLVASDTTTPAGTWSLVTPPLADGTRQVVARIEDLAGNQSGLSPALNVTVDTVAPPAATAPPDMTAVTDHGVSDSDNITNETRPVFTGVRPNDVAVHLVQGNVIFGQVLTIGPTSYSITTTALADGSYSFATIFQDIAGNLSAAGPVVNVSIDTVAPALVDAPTFLFANAPHKLRYSFDENVGPALDTADFSVVRQPATIISPAGVSYDTTTNVATVTLPGVLLDGRYTSTLLAGGVTDLAGNTLPANDVFNFQFLRADANNDGAVTLLDFNILASNFGQSGRNFTQGDFNYDSLVNLVDFNLLASRFGTSLASRLFNDSLVFPEEGLR